MGKELIVNHNYDVISGCSEYFDFPSAYGINLCSSFELKKKKNRGKILASSVTDAVIDSDPVVGSAFPPHCYHNKRKKEKFNLALNLQPL